LKNAPFYHSFIHSFSQSLFDIRPNADDITIRIHYTCTIQYDKMD